MYFAFDPRVEQAARQAMTAVTPQFARIEENTEQNQQRMLRAFIDNRVAETDLWGTTGYGYGDAGKEKAAAVAAQVFGAQDALISYAFACGTHTLTVMLFGILRPGDTMLCVTGRPYDTICPVIGMDGADGSGSLADFGIGYAQTDLTPDGAFDLPGIEKALADPAVRLVYIQRSRGYTLRPSLSVEQIEEAVRAVKRVRPDVIVAVDNCYGEFTERREPTHAGADLIAGSLIKNAGGGVAKCGGYIAGRRDLVEKCARRLTTSSLGREVGASLGANRDVLMGLFHAPHVTGEALKTAVFAAALFENLGFGAKPASNDPRYDIVQSVLLENSANLIAFCKGLQAASPVDSHLTPEPWDMPGYDNQVIMAAGTFTSGSSLELSGDAPLREPYAVWMQGGLNFHSAKIAVMNAANEVIRLREGV